MSKRKPNNIRQSDWDAVDSPELSDVMLKQMKPDNIRDLIAVLHAGKPMPDAATAALSVKSESSLKLPALPRPPAVAARPSPWPR